MNQLKITVAGLLVLAGGYGCTWVASEDSGKRVRVVASAAEVEGCESKGEITASVRDKVAFVARDPAKVNDELEALARNHAGRKSASAAAIADASETDRIAPDTVGDVTAKDAVICVRGGNGHYGGNARAPERQS